jgi:hypothetical protein
MALVTVEELRAYMSDVNLTQSQWAVAQDVIDGVQEELELFLNRPLELVQVRERVPADEAGYAILSVTPVRQVLSVQSSTTSYVESTVVTREPLLDADVNRLNDKVGLQNAIVPGGIYVGQPGRWYIVEYIGGWNGYVGEGIKRKIKEVASRVMTARHDDSMTVKGGIGTNPDAATTPQGWTEEELRSCSRLKRRVLV